MAMLNNQRVYIKDQKSPQFHPAARRCFGVRGTGHDGLWSGRFLKRTTTHWTHDFCLDKWTHSILYIYIHVQICSNCMCFEFYIQRFCETSLNESMNGKMISGQFNNVVLNDSSINGTSTNETDGWQLVLGGFSHRYTRVPADMRKIDYRYLLIHIWKYIFIDYSDKYHM